MELEVVFNRCRGFRDAKCGICKPKWGIYKPYCAVRRIGCNFAASIWVSARIDCEVDASFYEVSLHGWWRGINFAASMSAGRTYRYSLSIIHYMLPTDTQYVFFAKKISIKNRKSFAHSHIIRIFAAKT